MNFLFSKGDSRSASPYVTKGKQSEKNSPPFGIIIEALIGRKLNNFFVEKWFVYIKLSSELVAVPLTRGRKK